MRALIAGGTGLIGSAVAAGLVEDGYDVVVLTRRSEQALHLPPGVHAQRWDGRSAAGWGQLADGADVIINLAGESLSAGRWTAERKRRIRASRVNAGKALVEATAAAEHKPRLLIQASGIGHYGMHGDEQISEQSPAGTDFGAAVTLDWEAATAAVEQMGVRRVVVRMGPVMSTRGGFLPLMMLPFRFFAGGKIGSGKQWLSWVHMADVVGAVRFLIGQPGAQGAFNLCAPQPETNAGFSRALGKAMHRPSLVPVPAFAMKLVLGEMATVLLDGQRAVPERLLAMGYIFRFPDLESALRDLLP